MSLDSKRRFSQRADFYAKYRPTYPTEILSFLEREIGLDSGYVVADIGSGTGLLSGLFLKNGNTVFAVEPNESMRLHAERDLSGLKHFVSVDGTAERTTLRSGSIDLITVGQALHWFDPRRTIREFARISKPDGSLCVIYNERSHGTRIMKAYEAVIRRNERDRAKLPNVDSKYISRFFRGSKYSKFTVPNEQVLSFQGLLGRFLSASYMPTPEEKKAFVRVRGDVRHLFESYSSKGRVRLVYDTNVFLGKVGRRWLVNENMVKSTPSLVHNP